MKDSSEVLRNLAKNDYYQSLYSSAKELGLQIFINNTELTRIQLWLLSYMSMYSVINMDIAMGEVSEKVLDNHIYEDAYMYYKKKASSKDMKKKMEQIKSPSGGPDKEISKQSSWIFSRAK